MTDGDRAQRPNGVGVEQQLDELKVAIAGLPAESTLRAELELRLHELRAEHEPAVTPEPGLPREAVAADPRGAGFAWPFSGEGQAGAGTKTKARTLSVPLAVAVLAGIAVVGWLASTTPVPSVLSQERGAAMQALRSAGFDVEVNNEIRPVFDPNQGQILEQNPEAGTRLRNGSTVTIAAAELGTYDLTGTFELVPSDYVTGADNNCQRDGPVDDVKSGLQVTVGNGFGEVLKTGRLGPGSRSSGSCVFEFEVTGIPDSEIYVVAVGRRGDLTFTWGELASQNWHVEFTLG